MRWSVRSLALALAMLVLAACSAVPATSSTPSSSSAASITSGPVDGPPPSLSPEPSPSASAVPTEPIAHHAAIGSDSFARVVTNDLRVRSKPGVAEDSKKLEPLLQSGELLLVLDGPVEASGYEWYQVQPVESFEGTESYPLGWVAGAGKDGEVWITRAKVECPPLPTDLSEIVSARWVDAKLLEMMCFGDHAITFPARLVTPSEWCGLGKWPAVEPEWMGECTTAPNYLVGLDDHEGEMPLHPAWSPDVDLSIAPMVEAPPDDRPVVLVTGRFDHPEAINCRSPGESTDTPVRDRAMTVLRCRTLFVVTSLSELEAP
jgi:hypothetical protein